MDIEDGFLSHDFKQKKFRLRHEAEIAKAEAEKELNAVAEDEAPAAKRRKVEASNVGVEAAGAAPAASGSSAAEAASGLGMAAPPAGILKRVRNLGRTLSRQSSGASTPRAKRRKVEASNDGADDEDADWDEVLDDDLVSCNASVAPSSQAAPRSKLQSALAASPAQQQQRSPVKIGTSNASTARSPVSPLSPATPVATAKAPAAAKGGGKSAKAKAKQAQAGGKKIAIEPGHQKCSFCAEILPDRDFASGRAICLADDRATESLQRILRKRWGKSYAKNFKVLKSNKPKWVQGVISFRSQNHNRRRRVLGGGKDTLAEINQRTKRHRRERVTRKMTHHQHALHFGAPEHGGYDEAGLRKKWTELTHNTPPIDKRGVTNGVAGQPRWRVPLEDQDDSISQDDSEDIRQHKHETRPGVMSHQDLLDFLDGAADLKCDDQDDEDLPPEFDIAETPSTPAKPSTSSTVTPQA